MNKFIYKIWDEKSPVNGVSAEKVINTFHKPSWGKFYLILENETVVAIQRESHCPYPAETFEESARLDTYYRNHPDKIPIQEVQQEAQSE